MMRLFVAVDVDAPVRAEARRVVDQLRGDLAGTLRPKWVPVENMHLTVRFIGHVPDQRAGPVLDALAPQLEIAAFDVVLGDCGVFPPHGPPRVLWIGLQDGLPALRQLREEFNRRLLPLGFEPEARAFSAHLTLARIKDAPRGSGAAARTALAGIRVAPLRSRVSEAVVFESRLSPGGPTYAPLLRVAMRA